MIQRLFAVWALSLFVVSACLADDQPTWVRIGDQIYGAKADARGPIGGGAGYDGIVLKGDFVVRDLEALEDALAKAKAGQVVFIPGDAEIDLTTRIYIEKLVLNVPGGVTLASDRGHDGSRGALLTSDALNTPVMIRVNGPDARISGIRLQGPNPKRYLDHHRRAFGPGGQKHDYYYKFPTSDGIETRSPRLEVDNCEISAFSHAGIFLRKGDGHHVHHNFIHHCQYNGLGYGISHDLASSLIEFNLFDWNRHSIAGTGRPSCGYVARNNVELGTSLSHCFDMHGGRDRKDGTDVAGTSIEIHNNTFLAPQTPVVIRGVPEEKCEIHHNWFPNHDQSGNAAVKGLSEKTRAFDNAYGPDPKAAE